MSLRVLGTRELFKGEERIKASDLTHSQSTSVTHLHFYLHFFILWPRLNLNKGVCIQRRNVETSTFVNVIMGGSLVYEGKVAKLLNLRAWIKILAS